MWSSNSLTIGAVPFGRCPALIVVDMSNGFTSPDSPLGGQFGAEVDAMSQLLHLFRQQNWPVFFSTVVYRDVAEASVFRQHLPALNILTADSRWIAIDDRLAPRPGETIIEKTVPSAFFGTELNKKLLAIQADALVIAGLTTSGCVRATVVEALQYNWPVWVVPEACGDRNLAAHNANLHDMAAKYAEVVPLKLTLKKLTGLGKTEGQRDEIS